MFNSFFKASLALIAAFRIERSVLSSVPSSSLVACIILVILTSAGLVWSFNLFQHIPGGTRS